MNPPSMETIFLLLSGVILIAGVLYWFWSHLQLTQKKVQLLENAVFELRGMLASRPEPLSANLGGGGGPEPAYKDLTDDEAEWAEEEGEGQAPAAAPRLAVEKIVDTPDELQADSEQQADDEQAGQAESLQPGGRIQVPETAEAEETGAINAEQFRTMFAAEEGATAPPASPALSGGQSLEGMPVRDLRRLAEERGIKNAEALKKKELLAALRAQASTTLDLTAMGVVVNKEEAAPAEEEVPVLD